MTVQLGRQHRVNTGFLIELVAERQGWDESSRNVGTGVQMMGGAKLH